MGRYSAITPGTDLKQLARELSRIHEAVMGGSEAPRLPRSVVRRSWSRMLQIGLDAQALNARTGLSRDQVEERRRASPLATVIDEILVVLGSVADASMFLTVITDADGVILWRRGAAAVERKADDLGFIEGAVWDESTVGTNAIGTALTEAAPVQLFSAEHFEQSQHPWYCTAYPIRDPRSAELLGIVDISGPALSLHPAIEALVETAVQLAEARLWRRHGERLKRLRNTAEPMLAGVNGPLLVVDEHGWVAHHTGVAARDRVAVPEEDATLLIPELGPCVSERIGDGWLIRPRGATMSMNAVLDLTGSPVLAVTSGNDPWRRALSRRHAQILEILAASQVGASARELSQRLYGDDQHEVTVRAEVSRMRRVVGALVTSHPYQLAPGVQLTVRH